MRAVIARVHARWVDGDIAGSVVRAGQDTEEPGTAAISRLGMEARMLCACIAIRLASVPYRWSPVTWRGRRVLHGSVPTTAVNRGRARTVSDSIANAVLEG
jgi:hypothetical protein